VFVTYPWPVASAYVEPTGHQPPDAASGNPDGVGDTGQWRARNPDELVDWTGPERIRFFWYRLRLAICDVYRTFHRARRSQPTRR
jgi:hypothetical protein